MEVIHLNKEHIHLKEDMVLIHHSKVLIHLNKEVIHHKEDMVVIHPSKVLIHLNKEDMYRHVSKALDNVAVRTIKGNFLVLNPDSNDDREKYTSYKCTDDVKSFYESLPHK